ncbi:MAG: hypothetical protein OXI67_09595 [Candidatus Poribacteria bacterium]|nr:hypothetical protein [Candidatus Poribacteria bacterium]
MKQIRTFWQAVRDFWRTGKTGVALFLISLFALIYGYIALEFEIAQGWKGHVSVQNVTKDISAFIPVGAAFVAMIIGGIDLIMLLSDFIEARREKRIAAATEAAKAEGKAEGIAEGKAEGIAEGEARAYRKFAEWERRRKEAEDRGEEFTEPPPIQPQENSKE